MPFVLTVAIATAVAVSGCGRRSGAVHGGSQRRRYLAGGLQRQSKLPRASRSPRTRICSGGASAISTRRWTSLGADAPMTPDHFQPLRRCSSFRGPFGDLRSSTEPRRQEQPPPEPAIARHLPRQGHELGTTRGSKKIKPGCLASRTRQITPVYCSDSLAVHRSTSPRTSTYGQRLEVPGWQVARP